MEAFPNVIVGRTFFPVSDATANYNCIAWAVWSERQPIWPDERGQLGWPPELDREESVDAFRAFFEMVGFEECASGELEHGFEKIAIYAMNNLVTHAARQLPDGRWTSKMGSALDAEHATADVLCGNGLWQIALYMRRVATGAPPELPLLKPPPPLIILP